MDSGTPGTNKVPQTQIVNFCVRSPQRLIPALHQKLYRTTNCRDGADSSKGRMGRQAAVCYPSMSPHRCFWVPQICFSYKNIKGLLVGAVGIENNG
jgi:hypothetical protein